MPALNSWRNLSACLLFCAAVAVFSSAQTFTVQSSFSGFDLQNFTYSVPLVQGFDGNFYGLASYAGPSGFGAIFQLTPSGTATMLHLFGEGTDGKYPFGGLALGTNGNLYGTTSIGGLKNTGIIFESTPAGSMKVLHYFCSKANCVDGSYPYGGLVLSGNGNFWGTTSGQNTGDSNEGEIFQMSPAGTVFVATYLYPADLGLGTPRAALVENTFGKYFGSTTGGGIEGFGAPSGGLFEVTDTGAPTINAIHIFQGYDGLAPTEPMIQGPNGYLYGITFSGGIRKTSCPGLSGNAISLCGVIFSITPIGHTYRERHRFNGTDGSNPSQLLLGSDGNFYGVTYYDGANNGGTIFQMTPSGTLSTLYNFCSQSKCADGQFPTSLLQSTDGNFYGATVGGGDSGSGVMFKLSMGLAPFISTVPTSGCVGSEVVILGSNLTGATSVTFNGTATPFTVVSPTEITTSVPMGAKLGNVQVTTPSGNLQSNIPYVVRIGCS